MRMDFLLPSSVSLKLAMYPSSFRILAMSVFSFDEGTSTFAWRVAMALRMRVSMSAIGSDVVILCRPPASLLPTGLDYAGNFPGQRQRTEADAAQLEFS